MKKSYLPLLLLTLPMSFSCNSNNNLWNKDFKSDTKVYVNWEEKVENTDKTRDTLLKENFNNINFNKSGYNYYRLGISTFISFDELNEIYEFPIDSYDNFKSHIDSWWENDKYMFSYTSIYNLKINIDKSIYKFNSDGKTNNKNKGKVIVESPNPYQPSKTDSDVYYCIDDSEKQEGNVLNISKNEDFKNIVGYHELVKLSDGEEILHFLNGDDDSCANFTFVLNAPVGSVSEFSLNNYIRVKEVKTKQSSTIIVVSVLGSLVLGSFIVFVIVRLIKKKPELEVNTKK